jgi:hypothetical protein
MNRRRLGATTLVAVVGLALLVAVSSRNAASAPARAPATAGLQALRIFVDGRRVPVPSHVGIDPQGVGDRRLRVYVDGRRVADPVHHVLGAHDRIVVGYGRQGSFPTVVHAAFPPGL